MANYEASKIIEYLYQGGLPPRGDALHRGGVKLLVLTAVENQDPNKYTGIRVIRAPGEDDTRVHRLHSFIENWTLAGERVAEAVAAGENTLVTCMQGLNRSGLVVGIALCKLGMSGRDAVVLIQNRRSMALCNNTFAQYLVDTYK